MQHCKGVLLALFKIAALQCCGLEPLQCCILDRPRKGHLLASCEAVAEDLWAFQSKVGYYHHGRG